MPSDRSVPPGTFALAPEAVIVIPVLNHAACIGRVISDLQAQHTGWPIVVADGGSTDATRAVVMPVAQADPLVRLVENPGRTAAHAVNLTADIAIRLRARIVVRIDPRANYPTGYLRGMVDTLQNASADVVVTPVWAQGDTGWQAAAVRLQNTRLARGGPAGHGHHAALRLSAFLALGGYDTACGSDAALDFDARLGAEGGRVVQQGRWRVHFARRGIARSVWHHNLRSGRWNAATGPNPGWRGLQAIAGTLGVPVSALASLWIAALGPPAAIFLLALLVRSRQAGNRRRRQTLQIACLAAISHAGFAIGVLWGLVDPPRRQSYTRKAARAAQAPVARQPVIR